MFDFYKWYLRRSDGIQIKTGIKPIPVVINIVKTIGIIIRSIDHPPPGNKMFPSNPTQTHKNENIVRELKMSYKKSFSISQFCQLEQKNIVDE